MTEGVQLENKAVICIRGSEFGKRENGGDLFFFATGNIIAEKAAFVASSKRLKGAERVAVCASSKRLKGAERVGFEPTVVTRATTVFETAPIGRSGTSPS